MEKLKDRSTGVIAVLILLVSIMMLVNFGLLVRSRSREGKRHEEGAGGDAIPPDFVARGLAVIDSIPVTPGSSTQQGAALDAWQLAAIRRLEELLRVVPLPQVIPSGVSERQERDGFFESTIWYLATDDTLGWASIYSAVEDEPGPAGAIVLFLDSGRLCRGSLRAARRDSRRPGSRAWRRSAWRGGL